MEYIAHIRNEDRGIQTVSAHCSGVSEYAERRSGKLGLSSILRLAALLHDAGKCSRRFNDYIKGDNSFRRGEIDHSYAGAKYIRDLSEKGGNKIIRETADFIARIIVSHHGLHDWIDMDYDDYLKKRTGKDDDYDEILTQINVMLKNSEAEELIMKASAEYQLLQSKILALCNRDKRAFYFYMGMAERFAQSVLIDADRSDTAEFLNGITSEEFNAEKVWASVCKNVEGAVESFREKNDEISKMRMDISDRCFDFAKEPRKICRLAVPTGGGKTISSFRFAVNYCKNFRKSRIFYVAPFMSILEQNSDVLKSLIGNDELFLEHHSNIIAEMEESEELNRYELKCENWNVPVIATTTVQFLNAVFLGKMSSVRRFHQLSDSVIIIDEAQSIPLKCVYIFNLAMNFLANICGSVIVLCTATQPSLGDDNHPFPLLLDKKDSMVGDYTKDFKYFRRTDIIPKIKASGYTFGQAADFAYKKYSENKNLLVITNTKKAAFEMFRQLKEIIEARNENTKIVHLSTSMCPSHRKDKLDFTRRLLEKGKPVICVTTQLIEAGVDISFNCVIRSQAGLESIAQAAGRCNRNGLDKIRPVYIINLAEEKLTAGLKQIKSAQDISLQIMDNTEMFGNDDLTGNMQDISLQIMDNSRYDLLGDKAVSIYFNKLYNEYRPELFYKVYDSSADTCLLDLLSLNTKRRQICEKKHKEAPLNGQAFACAGKLFKVIDENTMDVIVPYNREANEIIIALNSEIDPKTETSLLRKSQRYTVNLFSNKFSDMISSGEIYPLKSKGIYALRKEAYNLDYGVENETHQFETLIY